MASTKKKIFVTLGVLAVVGIGYLIYSKLKITYWQFDDNYWLKDAENKLGFIGDKKPKFKVGDKIVVRQDKGAMHKQYDGDTTVQSIVKVGEKWVVSIPKTHRGSTPTNAGVIIEGGNI